MASLTAAALQRLYGQELAVEPYVHLESPYLLHKSLVQRQAPLDVTLSVCEEWFHKYRIPERPLRNLRLGDVLEYLCLGVRISRDPEGHVSMISSDTWLSPFFWLGWRMRAISKVYDREILELRRQYFASRREASVLVGVCYRLPPYPLCN